MSVDNSIQADRAIKWRIFYSTLLPFGMLANYFRVFSLEYENVSQIFDIGGGALITVFVALNLANGIEHWWHKSTIMQTLVGDESTVENRRRAQSSGFWAMVIGGIGVYTLCHFVTVPPHKAAQLVVVLALSVASLHFGWLEQRSISAGQ